MRVLESRFAGGVHDAMPTLLTVTCLSHRAAALATGVAFLALIGCSEPRQTSGGRVAGGGTAGTQPSAATSGDGSILGVEPNAGSQGLGGDPTVCADVDVTVTRTIPTIALLIEQSNSMDQLLKEGDPLTRWQALKDVLITPASGVIPLFERDARFGLVLYANPEPYFPQCPDLIEVMPPALGNYAKIATAFEAAVTAPNTPTAESMQAVTTRLEAVTDLGPKYVVLGTNGDPDNCDENGGFNQHDDDTKARVVSAVQAAYEKGIGTFVVSVGRGPTARAHLQQVANAGAGVSPDASPGAAFYEPRSRDELRDALAGLVEHARTCSFDLRGEVNPALAYTGTVTLDDTVLPMSDQEGWRLVNPSRIELVGPTCEALLQGEHDLQARFPCEVVVVR